MSKNALAELDDSIIKWIVALLIINAIIWLIALNGQLMPEGQTIATWFQRSGSLTLIISILIEIKLIRLIAKANNMISHEQTKKIPVHLNTAKKSIRVLSVYIAIMVHISTILSTLIWGYGDLMYCSIVTCLPLF